MTIDASAVDVGGPNESRRLRMLRRIGIAGSDTKGAVIKRATTSEELRQAYSLVHDLFVEQGYIQANACGMRVRPFEALPETVTMVAVKEEKVVGVQSLVADSSRIGLPSERCFGDIFSEFRARGGLVCEATNEAVCPEYRRSAVPGQLMRCLFAHAHSIGSTQIVTAVSPGHAGFYEFLGFETVSEPRRYPDPEKDKDEVILVRWDLVGLKDRLEQDAARGDGDAAFLLGYCYNENPFAASVDAWRSEVAEMFSEPAFLRKLFVEQSGLLQHCDCEALAAIRDAWGRELFDEVQGPGPNVKPVLRQVSAEPLPELRASG